MSTVLNPPPYSSQSARDVPRWNSEIPLFTAAVIIAVPLWIVLVISIVGFVYALFIAVFMLVAHALLVYHVRANGVRINQSQFPELYARVNAISSAIGLDPVPPAYLMQAGGVLNAFATKFLGSNMIVLNSELLEACEDNFGARDMIVGHELGHIKAGHLKWRWLIAPALIVPFLGAALSRAREFTCDRYGRLAAGAQQDAELGLIILAAGGRLAISVNRTAFVAQQTELTGFWMTLASLLASHPPLTKRVAALQDFRA